MSNSKSIIIGCRVKFNDGYGDSEEGTIVDCALGSGGKYNDYFVLLILKNNGELLNKYEDEITILKNKKQNKEIINRYNLLDIED